LTTSDHQAHSIRVSSPLFIKAVIAIWIWNGKRPLVSKTTITLDKNKGGLNIPTVEDICLASRAKMVYKIMHAKHSNWKCIGKHYLTIIDKMHGQPYFACSSSCLVGLNLYVIII